MDASARFSRYLQVWWDRQLKGATYPNEWRRSRDVDSLSGEFRRDTQFELSQARFLHRRPSEEVARAVVDRLVPVPTESDEQLLVSAIVRAGASAQKVRATTALGALITVFALVLRNILRGR